MSEPKPITLVGGGLAGLTLGIGLRQRGVPVAVWEAGRYPRHRVCGEFISGRGQQTLARLGLRDLLLQAGARPAETAAFFAGNFSGPARALPAPALCVSRFELDARLARRFRELGGVLRAQQRWPDAAFGEGVVRATGRRARPVDAGWRWFGVKVHARGVALAADLEMHVAPDGYVGLCRLSEVEVNVCGLRRRRVAAGDAAGDWRQLLLGRDGSVLRARLAAAEIDERSFCSVAGLSLRPERAARRPECCVGDALTMIPPVTGNGMSMAFESAELAIDPLVGYCRGAMAWAETQQIIARRCDEAFVRRLRWARVLHRLMCSPAGQAIMVRGAARWRWAWTLLFAKTR